MLRGDVYEVDFGPGLGREPSGRLPAVVVSNASFNVAPFALVVIPGWPLTPLTPGPAIGVTVSAAESGLPADSNFVCFLIRAADPSRVDGRLLGRLPAARLAEIDHILRGLLDLHPPPSAGRRSGSRP